MKASDFLEGISSELYFLTDGEKVYLMSSYHLGDEHFGYGIYGAFTKETVTNGDFSIEDVPEFFINDYFDFMEKDLVDTYGVSKEIANKLSSMEFDTWYDYLMESGCDPNVGYGCLKDICNALKPDFSFDGEVITDKGSEYEQECIAKYNGVK